MNTNIQVPKLQKIISLTQDTVDGLQVNASKSGVKYVKTYIELLCDEDAKKADIKQIKKQKRKQNDTQK